MLKPRHDWQPSKYSITSGSIRPSMDRTELATSSRVVANLVADFYSRVISEWASGDLADLGCGKAPLLGAYADVCDSVLLVDWENSEHPNPLLDMAMDLGQPLTSIGSNSLDTVLLSDVLEHIREPSILLSEIARTLRPGGVLLMNVPFLYRLHEEPYDYYRYTSHALRYLLQKAGFEVVELIPLGGWIEVMADMVGKMLAAAKLAPLVTAVHRLTMAFHRTSVGHTIATRTGRTSPLGYGVVAQKPKTEVAPQ